MLARRKLGQAEARDLPAGPDGRQRGNVTFAVSGLGHLGLVDQELLRLLLELCLPALVACLFVL